MLWVLQHDMIGTHKHICFSEQIDPGWSMPIQQPIDPRSKIHAKRSILPKRRIFILPVMAKNKQISRVFVFAIFNDLLIDASKTKAHNRTQKDRYVLPQDILTMQKRRWEGNSSSYDSVETIFCSVEFSAMFSNIGPVSFQGNVTRRDLPCASVNELLAELRQVYKECLAEVGNSGWTT